jgi:chromodomain-helicase-DNA-binding protein 7
MSEIQRSKGAGDFNRPVDAKNDGCPDYYEVITEPSDFSTIRLKLETNVYTSPPEFLKDVNLVFSNCFSYNSPELPIFKKAEVL